MTGGYVEKSFAPAPADLEAIGAFTRRAFAPEELYVFSVVLCNNDVDRDHEKFTRRALEELGALFVGKTGIFDHSMKSGDQAARIYATAVVPVLESTVDKPPTAIMEKSNSFFISPLDSFKAI